VNQFSKTIAFDTASGAAAFVEAQGLPHAAIEVAGIKWVNGSPKILGYIVRMPV
jgi:hypothetical protein